MSKLMTLLFASAAVILLATGAASAAPFPAAAVCKAAAAKATIVTKAHCRVVRRCGYYGCSYEEVCT